MVAKPKKANSPPGWVHPALINSQSEEHGQPEGELSFPGRTVGSIEG